MCVPGMQPCGSGCASPFMLLSVCVHMRVEWPFSDCCCTYQGCVCGAVCVCLCGWAGGALVSLQARMGFHPRCSSPAPLHPGPSEAMFPPPEHSCGDPRLCSCGPHRGGAQAHSCPWGLRLPGQHQWPWGVVARVNGVCDSGSQEASRACEKEVGPPLCCRGCQGSAAYQLCDLRQSPNSQGLSVPICKWGSSF